MVECVELRDEATGSRARVLAGFGFNLFSFVARDAAGEVELLWAEEGFESGEKRPSGSGTPLLFPFPGRLPGMEYSWGGSTYALESDDSRGNGIHGYVHRRPWRVTAQTANQVVATFQASVDDPPLLERWPNDFAIECEYALVGNAIDCRMTIRNPSPEQSSVLPCGLGSHPYFRLPLGPGDANQCRFTLPAGQEWVLADMLPTGERVDADAALQTGRAFEGLQLDNVFTGLTFAEGWFESRIEDDANNRVLKVRFDDVFSECVVYTPPHREAICIEPYTCLPGVGGQADYEHGWKELGPGESLTGADADLAGKSPAIIRRAHTKAQSHEVGLLGVFVTLCELIRPGKPPPKK